MKNSSESGQASGRGRLAVVPAVFGAHRPDAARFAARHPSALLCPKPSQSQRVASALRPPLQVRAAQVTPSGKSPQNK